MSVWWELRILHLDIHFCSSLLRWSVLFPGLCCLGGRGLCFRVVGLLKRYDGFEGFLTVPVVSDTLSNGYGKKETHRKPNFERRVRKQHGSLPNSSERSLLKPTVTRSFCWSVCSVAIWGLDIVCCCGSDVPIGGRRQFRGGFNWQVRQGSKQGINLEEYRIRHRKIFCQRLD